MYSSWLYKLKWKINFETKWKTYYWNLKNRPSWFKIWMVLAGFPRLISEKATNWTYMSFMIRRNRAEIYRTIDLIVLNGDITVKNCWLYENCSMISWEMVKFLDMVTTVNSYDLLSVLFDKNSGSNKMTVWKSMS